ncbi:MAG: pirin family protein [Verrucomicrobiae bacterium]|nr:pirin family protein [Verrucomicrobiae bacterium]
MIAKRPSNERGHANHGWLDTYHTFSFADYHDPAHMEFRSLRVINEDRVEGGQGFGTHPHRDMEIVTYVLEGALEHRDSMGNHGVIHSGEVQRITAGAGIQHSEFNASQSEPVHLLQIWLLPNKKGLKPSYEERTLNGKSQQGKLRLIAANVPRDGAAMVNQDVELHVARLAKGENLSYPLKPGRHAWVQVTRGSLTLNGVELKAGDGAAVSEEKALALAANDAAEALLFDLA